MPHLSVPRPYGLDQVAGLVVLIALQLSGCASGSGSRDAPAAESSGPSATYYVYVAAESSDLLHRVRFGPDGAVVDRTIPVGEMANETEGPHGLALSPGGEFVYMTTGHGIPDGKLWKFEAGPDTLVGDPVPLGFFPSTLDLTPDGLYAFVANFNLHGELRASSISVVYTPDMVEVDQIETCVMPHGARLDHGGDFLYSVCMRDDQLVEVDTHAFRVTRRFSVSVGRESPAPSSMEAGREALPSCSPTWAVPSRDGESVYVACNAAGHVLEVDRAEWGVTRRIPTGPGPYNLALTPDGSTLIATLKAGAGVQFIDLERGESAAISPSSTTLPHGVVTSPDGLYAFVSVEGVRGEPGKVDVFDLRTRVRVADVDVGLQAGGIVFWRMEP